MYPSSKTDKGSNLNSSQKKDGVDKGTNRQTPGNNQGARPPREEEYEKIKVEKENNLTKKAS